MALALLGAGPDRGPSAQEAAHASPARPGDTGTAPATVGVAEPGPATVDTAPAAVPGTAPATAAPAAPTTATAAAPVLGEPSPTPVGEAVGETAESSAAPATAIPATSIAPAPGTASVDPTALDFAHASLSDIRAATLARISYPWQTRLPGWTIDFLPGKDGYLGATWSRAHRIEIYVRDGQTVDELAFTLAHELGHAVDLTYFDETDRDRWLAGRGVAGASWWTDSGAGDYAVGAGDFAESFAVWQVGGRSLSTLAGQPTDAQLALLTELVTR